MLRTKKRALWLFGLFILTFPLILTGCQNGGETEPVEYPADPITFIVNYGPGGSYDMTSRQLCGAAEGQLGVPINIINKQGGSGVVGMNDITKADPDGYTIGCIGLSGVAILPHMQEMPYEPLNDFTYICGVFKNDQGLSARADSPLNSLEDIINEAKARPGEVSIASTSYPVNLAIAMLEDAAGIKFKMVPFDSGAEAIAAALGGHTDLVAQDYPETSGFLESEKMKLLAPLGSERWDLAPDVPTASELGYKDVIFESWFGFAAPKDIPPEKRDILESAFEIASRDQHFIEFMTKLRLKPSFKSGEEFTTLVEEAYARYGNIINKMGLGK